MRLWNGLHKLPIAISGKTYFSLWIKASKMIRWWSFEYIWQPEKGLVVSSWPFLLPITNSIKLKSNFQRISDNPLSKYSNFFAWIICYLAASQQTFGPLWKRKPRSSNVSNIFDPKVTGSFVARLGL